MARGLADQLAEYRAKLNMSDMSKISTQCISNHIYVTTKEGHNGSFLSMLFWRP